MINDGFYDRAASHGPVTGSGPGFAAALRKFAARQVALSQVGTWRWMRKGRSNRGRYIDRDWDIITY